MAERKLPPITRKLKYVLYGGAIWISLALLGYGVALKNHVGAVSENEFRELKGLEKDDGLVTGNVKWVDVTAEKISFKVDSVPYVFEIPSDISEKKKIDAIIPQLKEGTPVKLRPAPDLTIRQLRINPNTANTQDYLFPEVSAKAVEREKRKLAESGDKYIWWGILLTPLLFGVNFVIRKIANRPRQA